MACDLRKRRKIAMSRVAIDEYICWQKNQKRRTRGTLRVYGLILARYAEDVVGDRKLDEVTLEEIETWVQRPRTGGQNGKRTLVPSAATVSRDTTILRGLYSWAHARGVIARNPTELLSAPAPHNENPRPVDDDTWMAWWECDLLPAEVRSVLTLGFFGGLRRGELAALRTEQVVFEPELRVVNFRRKGGGEDTLALGTGLRIHVEKLPHLLPDPEVAWAALRAATLQPGPLVPWVNEYHEDWRAQEVARLVDRAARGLRLPRFTLHQLRHSCATNLLRARVPIEMVSRYMNHKNISTTMRYVKSGGDELAAWLGS
jgi:integrase